MKTVKQVIEELSHYPEDALVAAYVAEDCGLVIYKPEHAIYGWFDPLCEQADESIGFVRCYYDDNNRPGN